MGGHYWRKGEGEKEKENPVLPMGRHKKSLVDHRKFYKYVRIIEKDTMAVYTCGRGVTTDATTNCGQYFSTSFVYIDRENSLSQKIWICTTSDH